ncbi:hypothetical protein ETAA8_05670 [Anatilimnocola aggregata]|uniref:Uncharacterized protein n=1 Tax=Anatilimnocola aggregata TaxID=2528021 RepID=A0A517Y5I1_9BACT|nr:DUF1922 domain-containing protein [Anatilimnocola aggregata]QDU25498.1 hypothetical protein ETAA8_05670 [Anatilimnocola aggregata]
MTTTQPQLFLVPCSCGEKLRVRGGQAGEKLTCKCGASVAVPTVRQLRQLETVEDASAPQPAAAWTAWQGPLFSIGALLLFVGVGVLVYTRLFSVLPSDELKQRFEVDVKRAMIPVEQLGAADLLDEFNALREQGRTTEFDYVFEQAHSASAAHQTRQLVGNSLAGIGGLLVVAGIAMALATPRRG